MVPTLTNFSAIADSARQLVQSGNEAYMAGDYEKSLEQYERAAESEPDSPIILFNKGNVLYKKGAYDEAIEVFEQAAIQSIQNDNQELEAKSRFNMGNSAFQKAEILRTTDLQKSLEIYEQSAENYQAALQVNPQLFDAGHNLEMARKAANQLLSEIKKQEQQQQQMQDAQEQLAEELNELLEQQQDAAQESEQLSEAQQQQGTKEGTEQKAGDLAEQQQAIKEKTRQLAEKTQKLTEQPGSPSPDEKTQKHLEQAVREQQQAEDNLTENLPEQARQNQERAAAEMNQALAELNQQHQQESQQAQQGQDQEQQEASQAQSESSEAEDQNTGEEVQSEQVPVTDRTAQDILDEETANRSVRQGRSVTGYQPVEKDW